jgi:hypothetical protein
MARNDLTERVSWDDSHSTVAYTADALSLAGEDGDSAAAALAAPVEKHLDRWEKLDGERRAGKRRIGRAHALVRRRDLQADEVATSIHHDVLGHVKQDREAPLFARLFPDPLSGVVKLALESQLPVMRALARELAEGDTPASLKKKHTKPLADAIERGAAALATREEAFAASGRTTARIASWREDVNHTLRGVEGALLQLAAERRLDRAWVDSFFPSTPGRKKKARPAPDASGTPA